MSLLRGLLHKPLANLPLIILLSCAPEYGQAPDPPAADRAQWSPASYVNRELPSSIRLSGEFRARPEGRSAFGFREGKDDAYVLTRLRLNLEIQPEKWLHVFVQGQDSRATGIDPSRVNSSLKDIFDLRQAFVEFESRSKGWFSLRVGRQEMRYGAERLIGASDWTNSARTFDAVKLVLKADGARFDIFASSVVVNYPTSFDEHLPGQNFYGIYGSLTKLVPGATLEPYALSKTLPKVKSERGQFGDADILTFGLRWAGKLPAGFDYAAETARQGGHFATDDVATWAGYGIVGYTPPRLAFKPRVSAEYAYASGDRAVGDGKTNTFDQLYPTPHGVRGLTDQFGWRNLRDVRAGVEIKPNSKTKVAFDYFLLWLASVHDGLYSTAGALVIRAPANGALHQDVGSEADVYLTYAPVPQIQLGAGFGHLFAGRFLKENSPGSGMSFPYVFCYYMFK